jgi:hypothetical protein
MTASLIQRRLSRAGLSRQTAGKGTAAAAATYGYGVDGGSIFKLALEENEIPLTWSNRDILGFDRSGVKPGQSVGTVATPNLIGLLLLGILGSDTVVAGTTVAITGVTTANPSVVTAAAHGLVTGQWVTIASVGGATQANGLWQVTVLSSSTFSIAVNVTGTYTTGGTVTPSYTHTLTPAAVLPYLTAWGFFGTADWAQLVDSKISSLELSWTAAGKVAVKAEISSITPAMLGTAYTETYLETLTAVGYFTAGGGTFNVEGVGAAIASGSIKFDTHIVQPIVAATVLPADVVEGKLEVTWSLKILPTDTHLFRGVYFGAETLGALSGIANTPRIGAVACEFMGPNVETLTISSPSVRFMVEFPESSPDGGPAELTLAGTSTLPNTGSSVTATLVNAVSGY